MNDEVKITHRDWPGHFCAVRHCLFRLNSLLEYGDEKIVVSTVGLMEVSGEERFFPIVDDHHFETMAFGAKYDGKHWDMDVKQEINFDSQWRWPNVEDELKANDGHHKVVDEIADKMKKGTVKYCYSDYTTEELEY